MSRLESLTRRKTPGTLLAFGLLSLVGLSGCATAPTGPGNAELDAARTKLTQVAGNAMAPVATGDTTFPTPGSGDPLIAGATPVTGDDAAVAATRIAADATAGIPSVRDLVKGQVPLATFTPNARAAKPTGTLLYLRGGKFREVSAAGGDGQELKLTNPDMPAVWAPADDPGRAWSAPDGRHVAFFAGPDAEMWVMGPDGSANTKVSGPNLPSGLQKVTAGGGQSQDVRLRPKVQYTLVYGAGEKDGEPFAVLVDNNERHIKGEGRMRFVHAAPVAKDQRLTAWVNGAEGGSPMAFGRSSGDFRVLAGSVAVEIRDSTGKVVQTLAPVSLGERELKTVYLTGDTQLEAVPETYEVMPDPPSDASLVRVFNAGNSPLDAQVAGTNLAVGLAAKGLSPYARITSPVSIDRRKDLEMGLYGLRPLEAPVAWSPDGSQVAWVASPAGVGQIMTSSPAGPAKTVTTGEAERLNPTWSPDSRNLAWVEVDPVTSDQVVAYLADGKVGRMDPAPIKAAMGVIPGARISFPEDVTWADETSFFLYPVSDRRSAGIWKYDVASGELTQVEKEPVSNPSWSPTARAWVYGLQGDDVDGKLFVLPVDGSPKQLPVDGRYAQWLPDGQRISWVEGDPKVGEGWAIHVIGADGSGDKKLTEKLPTIQSDPPVPGPNPKRFWLDGGKLMGFTLAGTDYGAREEAGFGSSEAGNDIENLWVVPTDGSAPPKLATDLMKVFYMKELAESPSRDGLGFVAFAYDNRSQQLYAAPANGGKPVQLDSGVRWFQWQPGPAGAAPTP
jgi:hypothetical protein